MLIKIILKDSIIKNLERNRNQGTANEDHNYHFNSSDWQILRNVQTNERLHQ